MRNPTEIIHVETGHKETVADAQARALVRRGSWALVHPVDAGPLVEVTTLGDSDPEFVPAFNPKIDADSSDGES